MPKINITHFRYSGLLHGNPVIQEIELNGGLTTQFCRGIGGKNEIPEGWEDQDFETHINPKWLSIQAMPLWMKKILEDRWGVKLTPKEKTKKESNNQNVLKTITIDDMQELLKGAFYMNKKHYVMIDDLKVSVRRVMPHMEIGMQCVSCPRKGVIYKLWQERKTNALHLDLYAEDGELMTLDHIKPHALGGEDKTENYQMMCAECNTAKGCS